MKKSLIVAKREYIKVVRKPSFWLSTLFFPVFIVAVTLISGFSSVQFEEKLKSGLSEANKVLIVDESNFIKDYFFVDKIERADNLEESITEVVNGNADAVIYFPADVTSTKALQIYTQDQGLFLNERYNSFADTLLKQSILSDLNDPAKVEVYNSTLNYQVTTYKDGVETNFSLSKLLVPGISLVLYFILTTFATSYLLLSVSEEKENRVMEIVLSAIKPKDLIVGKIIGLIGIIITQVLLLIVLSIIGVLLVGNLLQGSTATGINPVNIPLGSIDIEISQLIGQIILGIIFTLSGFFILACVMVGVGAASPTYKEAQSLSSIFILISIFPIYFITTILGDPSGTLAQILSYLPFTASLILLLRSALDALSTTEAVIGVALLVLYCVLGVILAFKLFEFGALEYNKKISISEFISGRRKSRKIT
ncbi:putative protein YhaP [Candidatus Brocadiaceae bacterium]|nr:putative protein YhaP [Candidatus Brocadiaceae bacterium]